MTRGAWNAADAVFRGTIRSRRGEIELLWEVQARFKGEAPDLRKASLPPPLRICAPLEMFSAPRALFSCSFLRIHATTYVTWPSLPPCQSLQPHECTLAMSEFSVLTVQAGRGVPGCVASVFFTRCPMILAHQPSRLVPRWAPCGHSLGRWGPSPRSQSDGSSVQLVSRYY
jgi:hypothetical protein